MIRVVAILLVVTPTALAASPARYGRIDVYSVDGSFDVRDVHVCPGAQMLDVRWRGEGMAATGATAQARVRGRWREIWIEVTPERDGKLQINFQGEYYQKVGDDDVRLVWVDDIRVHGADVTNGDMEDLEPDGKPCGWIFSGTTSAEAVSCDGSIASSGKVCASVWWGSQLRQVIDVRGGEPVRVTAVFRAFGPEIEPPEVAEHKATFRDLLEMEDQTVSVTLKTPEAAKRASVRPLPLYGGAQWAITSRWDDNHLTDLKTRKVLLDHGHSGTFFLNDPNRNFYGDDYGLLGDRPRGDIGRILASGGTTVGGHSLTHPMLSYQNRNRMFEEVLGCRIALEAAFDTLVNAYAFSFCNYTNTVEGADVQRDIGTLLARSGYLQVANHRFADNGAWPWGIAGLLPPDGRPIDNQFAGFLADEDLCDENPAITYSMHSWYDTPEKWTGFESDLDRYGRRPEWWYCNHNQYGAYRAQYRSAIQGSSEVDERTVTFRFSWPALVDLNDPTPLTFEIARIKPDEVTAITSTDARVERVDSSDDTVRFHLHHAGSIQLPARIDHVASDDGQPTTSAEFPAISGALDCNGSHLALSLRNAGLEPIEVHRVTYRLPVRYRPGVVRKPGFRLAAGKEHADLVPLEEGRQDGRYHTGTYYFAVQVDFLLGGSPGRVYFTTHRLGSLDDPSYPQRGFSALGPILCDQIDLASLPVASIDKQIWTSADGRKLTFEPVNQALAKPFSAEVIPIRGRWDNRNLKPCVFLLCSTVTSPKQRKVRCRHVPNTVTSIWLNGRVIDADATLKAGENDLLLAYEPPSDQRFSPEHAGPMFRIVEAQTGKRLPDIRYQR